MLKVDGLFSLLELCNKLFKGKKFHIMTKRYVAYCLYFKEKFQFFVKKEGSFNLWVRNLVFGAN
jgi:hypothetical protein